LLEEFPLRADDKRKFAARRRRDLPQMPNELECIGPMQAPWQFAMEQSLMQRRQFMMEMLGHVPAHPATTRTEYGVLRNDTSPKMCNEYR
jgi:hypothetical protein